MASNSSSGPVSPWWRHPMVWLVIGGPAVVVLASFATLALALRHPDAALRTQTATAQHAPAEESGEATQPAMLARNHAATAGR